MINGDPVSHADLAVQSAVNDEIVSADYHISVFARLEAKCGLPVKCVLYPLR